MSMPPEVIAALLQSNQPQQTELARKQKMIDKMRGQAQEGMQGQMVSGHYVAPNPVTMALSGLNQYQLEKQQGGVTEGLQKAENEEVERRKKLAQMAMDALRRGQPGGMPGMVGPPAPVMDASTPPMLPGG